MKNILRVYINGIFTHKFICENNDEIAVSINDNEPNILIKG